MAKVSGSYESVVRGVSQQTPHDRRSGQHEEQINMISDPVRGLVRRQGSRLMAETAVVGAGSLATLLADTKNHRVGTFYIEGVEYDLIHRTTAAPVGAGAAAFMWAFNRSTNQFIPVVRSTGDLTMDRLVSGGVSAMVGIGRYVYIAGNTITPEYTATSNHDTDANRPYTVVWVRGGAYSQTFKIKLTLSTGAVITASYKTVSSSYPELLDTSDIQSSDPDYQKKVNDRVYAYNSEVTKWIGVAAADITPENIATLLATSLTSQGIANVTVRNGTVCIGDNRVTNAEGEDGGDGSLIRVVDNEITSPELVSSIHYAGKVVRVKPQRSREDDAFYLKAVPKDPNATGFTEVTWKECAGYTIQPDTVFAVATVYDGKLYIAGSPARLQELAGIAVPGFKPNGVGDQITCPLPSFFGKKITYLGQFQDRLVVGSGATVFMSCPGDYLNFWRQSVLTVVDSDPVEMYALGAEDDVIRYGTTFDRDLILYGTRFQYAISGRQPLTPKNASIVTASAYKDANAAAPRSSGNFVFYAKYTPVGTTFKTSLHQVGAGQLQDQAESYNVSQQLDDYIVGKPSEIVAMQSPNVVFLRTDARRDSMYTYTYLDVNGQERLFDSWSRWRWHPMVGSIIGISAHDGGLAVYLLRSRNGILYVAAERFVLETSLSTLPYADSLQPLANAEASPQMANNPEGAIVALQRDGGPHQLMGQPYSALADFKALYPSHLSRAWAGFSYDAYVTPTNPYYRDQNGNAVLGGRMTLSQIRVSVADTAAMLVEVESSSGNRTALDFNGKVLGKGFRLGEQPIVTTILPAFIGKEVRECRYTLRSKAWLPLNITNIEWTAQVFNRTRRV